MAAGARDGEVQPEVAGFDRTAAIENGVGGNEDAGLRLERDFAFAVNEVAAGFGVVVEAPEGAVHAFVIPIGECGLVAAFVNEEGGPTCLGDPCEIDAPRRGVVQILPAFGHEESQICSCSVSRGPDLANGPPAS